MTGDEDPTYPRREGAISDRLDLTRLHMLRWRLPLECTCGTLYLLRSMTLSLTDNHSPFFAPKVTNAGQCASMFLGYFPVCHPSYT